MLTPVDHYRYLTKARQSLFERVKGLSPEQYEREFPLGLRTVRRTLQHMAGAEWFVLGQLPGGWPPGGLGENPFSPQRVPDAAALEAAWRAWQPRTIEIINREADWSRPVEITIVIPSRQRFRVQTTAIKAFSQFCYHEVHHRSQVMAMLRQLDAPVENLDFLWLTADAFEEVRA